MLQETMTESLGKNPSFASLNEVTIGQTYSYHGKNTKEDCPEGFP
jgi:hypothetical protein